LKIGPRGSSRTRTFLEDNNTARSFTITFPPVLKRQKTVRLAASNWYHGSLTVENYSVTCDLELAAKTRKQNVYILIVTETFILISRPLYYVVLNVPYSGVCYVCVIWLPVACKSLSQFANQVSQVSC